LLRSRLNDPGLEPGPPRLRSADDVHVALGLAHLKNLDVRQGVLEGLDEVPEPLDLGLLLGIMNFVCGVSGRGFFSLEFIYRGVWRQ
jgi:hypothetical protein